MSSTPTNPPHVKLYRRHRCAAGHWIILPVKGPELLQIHVPQAVPYLGLRSVRHLIAAGFVAGRQVSGAEVRVCVRSLLSHLHASSRGSFWTPDRMERYLAARAKLSSGSQSTGRVA